MSISVPISKLNIEQFKNAPNFNKVLKIAAITFDELNIVFSEIKTILDIEKVTGSSLDLIGKIVKQKRGGISDSEYRNILRLKIFKNTSNGFVESIINILKVITNATRVVYSDNPPASYTVYTDGSILPSGLTKEIDFLSVAGVSLEVYKSSGVKPIIFHDQIEEKNFYILVDNEGNEFINNFGDTIIVTSQLNGSSQKVSIFEDGSVVLNEDGTISVNESFSKIELKGGDSMTSYELFNGGPLNVLGLNPIVDNFGNNLVTNNGDYLAAQNNETIVGEYRLVIL